MSQYPAAVAGFGDQNGAINNASSILTTTNENNITVAVGYARPQSSLVSWLLIVEQSHSEAWAPINHLRSIVLSCVFGTIGFIILIILPIAHFSVRPIRRLRDATEKSIAPPGYTPNGSIRSQRLNEADLSGDETGDLEVRRSPTSTSRRSKRGIFMKLRKLTYYGKPKTETERTEDERRRVFKIPAKVQDRKHFITDELTELTSKFISKRDYSCLI
jgi:osomolarity two-component system sensor histidine kinase SLN1